MTAKRSLRGEEGAALIEFALTLPLLLMIIGGICDFGLLLQRYAVLSNAAREGARMGSLPGYTESDVTARVSAYATAGGVKEAVLTSMVSVPVTPETGSPFTAVEVTVTMDFEYTFLGPIAEAFQLGTFNTKTLTAKSVMRTEVAAGGG